MVSLSIRYNHERLLAFDNDGCLRDETPSYQRCKAETVGYFDPKGRRATPEEIGESIINSNDDWEGSQWILKQRGTDVPLEKITEHFQKLYWGRQGYPKCDSDGYINDEIWLANNDLLKEMSLRYPMAIVSGAPKDEIIYTMEKNSACGYFGLIVGMHDAGRDTRNATRTAT